MPHACRRCFVPYGLRFEEIFGDFWSPCSICESRTHMTSTKGKCMKSMKIHENIRQQIAEILTKSWKITRKALLLSKFQTLQNPDFYKIYRKSQKINDFWTSYGSGSHRSNRNRQKSLAHMHLEATLRCLRVSSWKRTKLSTQTTKMHSQGATEPPHSYIWEMSFRL